MKFILDVDPRRDDDASPMSLYRCMLRPTWMILALRQKSKFEFRTFLKKKNQIFGFPWCSTREDLSIDVSITNEGLILTKLRWFLFSGYGQTDTHGFGILTWKHVGTQKISTQNSKLVVSRRSLYASPEEVGCIISYFNNKTFKFISKFVPLMILKFHCNIHLAGIKSYIRLLIQCALEI